VCAHVCIRASVCVEKSKYGHHIIHKRMYFMIKGAIQSNKEHAFINKIIITQVKSWVWLHFISTPPKKTLVGTIVPTGTAMGTTVVVWGVSTSIAEEWTAPVCHPSDSHAVVMLKITAWILYSGAPGQVITDNSVDIYGFVIADWQCGHWLLSYSWQCGHWLLSFNWQCGHW
jgi:hypothetical protein